MDHPSKTKADRKVTCANTGTDCAQPLKVTRALTVEPLEVTRLLLELVLQLVGVLEDLLVLGRHEADVVLVHLQLLQRVNQLHLLGEQQLVLELGVNQLQRVRQREVVDLCDVTITQALM